MQVYFIISELLNWNYSHVENNFNIFSRIISTLLAEVVKLDLLNLLSIIAKIFYFASTFLDFFENFLSFCDIYYML